MSEKSSLKRVRVEAMTCITLIGRRGLLFPVSDVIASSRRTNTWRQKSLLLDLLSSMSVAYDIPAECFTGRRLSLRLSVKTLAKDINLKLGLLTVRKKVIIYYTNDKRTCLNTINKLPRRTAQVPVRRPRITTGFSQARSCHTRR